MSTTFHIFIWFYDAMVEGGYLPMIAVLRGAATAINAI